MSLELRPELSEEVSGIAISLVATCALSGWPVEEAVAELHRRFKEILEREGLTPEEIGYLHGKIKGWPPGQAEEWAAGYRGALTKGMTESVLCVLETRGLPVSDDTRERTTTCTDLDRLDGWLRRACTAERAEELFGEE